MSRSESKRRDLLRAGTVGAAASLIAGAAGRTSGAASRVDATTYTVSPTNFMIVSERVRQGLEMVVGGQPGRFSSGLLLTPKDLDNSYQKYIQIGLTLPPGRVNSLSLNYACEGESFITQINLLEVTNAGETRVVWHTQEKQAGAARFSPVIDTDFEGSLDLTVGVMFRAMNERIQIGALSFLIV